MGTRKLLITGCSLQLTSNPQKEGKQPILTPVEPIKFNISAVVEGTNETVAWSVTQAELEDYTKGNPVGIKLVQTTEVEQ